MNCGPNHPNRIPPLSLIVVSFNTRDLLQDCLRSIPAGLGDLSGEIWVVDNASSDGSPEMVATSFPDVHLVRSETNLGFARANNLALAQASGEFLVLLNPDTECDSDSLKLLVKFLEEHPRCGACAPRLLNSDRSLQPNGSLFPTPGREWLQFLGFDRLAPRWYAGRFGAGREDLEQTCRVDSVSGACLAIRREALDQVGPLDERFFLFFEEVDWCRRAATAGWEIWLAAESTVVHHWMGSVRLHVRQANRHYLANLVRYHRKHHGWVGAALVLPLYVLGWLRTEWRLAGSRVKRLVLRGLARGWRP